jgi:hypothetical protein
MQKKQMAENGKDQCKKATITDEALKRINVIAFQLLQLGLSFRILSIFLFTKSYSAVYKHIIEHNEDAPRGRQRRPPSSEIILLKQFEEQFPKIAAAMENRDITPRVWCFAHSVFYDNGCDACISGLLEPDMYEYTYDIPVQSLLENDFPEAFGLSPKFYRARWIDPELYYSYEIEYPNGSAMHIMKSAELRIKVMNKSKFVAFHTFAKRLINEVTYHRLTLLRKSGITEENIKAALAWLPEDVSQTRTHPDAENTGSGHVLLREEARKSEERAQMKREERARMKLEETNNL